MLADLQAEQLAAFWHMRGNSAYAMQIAKSHQDRFRSTHVAVWHAALL